MFTSLCLDLLTGRSGAIQRGLSPNPRWRDTVDATLELTHERVDDVPLLLAFLIKLQLPVILDRHLPPHPLHQGLSNGWLITVWIAYVLSRADHRKSPVQGEVALGARIMRLFRDCSKVTGADLRIARQDQGESNGARSMAPS